ncbi:hypothetical protein V8G54_020095 [Vigna mungo]|uniref:Uncharacterized protein n=1 Tax=Vigna mungo TaxID=3915 RepID=A0AAQ3NB92_VIGMU
MSCLTLDDEENYNAGDIKDTMSIDNTFVEFECHVKVAEITLGSKMLSSVVQPPILDLKPMSKRATQPGPPRVGHLVVKKLVTKLLQAGIIYHISNNTWVSLVHVVPKKSRIIMVKNEKDELIPTGRNAIELRDSLLFRHLLNRGDLKGLVVDEEDKKKVVDEEEDFVKLEKTKNTEIVFGSKTAKACETLFDPRPAYLVRQRCIRAAAGVFDPFLEGVFGSLQLVRICFFLATRYDTFMYPCDEGGGCKGMRLGRTKLSVVVKDAVRIPCRNGDAEPCFHDFQILKKEEVRRQRRQGFPEVTGVAADGSIANWVRHDDCPWKLVLGFREAKRDGSGAWGASINRVAMARWRRCLEEVVSGYQRDGDVWKPINGEERGWFSLTPR